METQFGLSHVWSQGDWVIRTVALILLAMSVASWVVIALKALNLRRHRAQARAVDNFWHSKDFAEGLNKLGPEGDNPFYLLALQGREATSHILHLDGEPPRQLHDSLDVSEWVTRSLRNALDDFTTRLQSGLAILASVGSTAPFVGLFGTVWGIYHALLGIGAAGSATIDKVAGPIGEALIMTALGLVVAIPAVLGYNALVRGNKGLLHKLNRFAHDLHAYFVTGARVGAGTPADAKVRPIKQG
ncbi:MotA/TolQ/ExbB proton channel family protein [Aquabacterium sp. A08]|uniref:MotA/TolQ/ExbB proton channel family protein n=1 Tax=Aquabacterium sp. A08 TaxID=2718532 RepID=UPI00141E0CE1|nr:MotA/TolQ/ExbB proton channel family protein [Aquabacterium sp. A08]NIC42406.1 MotA/TolQ/ExbB proton channel family protein [Aquabacterium sp. A08]